MAELARGPDYLKLHANVRNRVRNLETGVHPTGAELRYYDTIPPTNIGIRSDSAWHVYESGVLSYQPRWQRRVGIVMLSGAVALDNGLGGAPSEDFLATLPPEARPTQGQLQTAAAESSPYRARLRIQTDGELYVLGGDLGADAVVWLDGASWPVN
jgi:hypothetical protein